MELKIIGSNDWNLVTGINIRYDYGMFKKRDLRNIYKSPKRVKNQLKFKMMKTTWKKFGEKMKIGMFMTPQ